MSRNSLMAVLVALLLTLIDTTVAAADSDMPRGRMPVGGGTGLAFLRGGPLTDHALVYICTLTTIGYDAAGNLVGLTNAHCVYDGDKQWPGDRVLLESAVFTPGAAIDVLGMVEYISGGNPIVPGPNGPGLDYAVIVFDKSIVEPVATVGKTTIRGVGSPPPAGTSVCKQGAASDRSCGTTLTTTGPYLVNTISEIPGDSGAPMVAGDTLVGNQWMWGAGTAITDILADLDRRGGIGAGFRPVSP
ncbi:hypothetical protein [Nocardia sp. NBC_00403]|uniref:hypothetical protein n=1 Tax=Nocardia sp. NBC_00403 TaxID=2975990 RepID=UPI002E228393